jgi:RNA polymerase-binding protein DksA
VGSASRRKGAFVSAIDTGRFRQALTEERQRIQAALDNLHEENPGSITDETGEDAVYDNHLADTATVTYDRELDYTLEENSEHMLAEIDAALHRIEDGTYGKCTNCGKEIAPERLEARPWATLCIDCQRTREGR